MIPPSQLLQYVHKIAPRGIYTSGKGSSAVGLTASVSKDPDTGETVDATMQTQVLRLPAVMVLALKRFAFGYEGGYKLDRPVDFPAHLTLPRQLLAEGWAAADAAVRGEDFAADWAEGEGGLPEYELAAVVRHHGEGMARGHYTADVRAPDAPGQGGRVWRRYDDSAHYQMGDTDVLTDDKGDAYMLVYRRCKN